jgi:putative endonuclease
MKCLTRQTVSTVSDASDACGMTIGPPCDIEDSPHSMRRSGIYSSLSRGGHDASNEQRRVVMVGHVWSRSELAKGGEDVAASYLARRGWTIVGRNVRCGRMGEIDIIAERSGVLAFVEVKTRSTDRFGTPGEAVTWRKQARIRAMARQYLMTARRRAYSVRFDVIEVRLRNDAAAVTHLEGCF